MGPLSLNSDYREWKALLHAADVPDGRLHDTRYAAATVLLVLGVPKPTVRSVMGWSSTAMAARYQHVTDPIRCDVADRIGGLLWADQRISGCLESRARLDADSVRPDPRSPRRDHCPERTTSSAAGQQKPTTPRLAMPSPGCVIRSPPRQQLQRRRTHAQRPGAASHVGSWGLRRQQPAGEERAPECRDRLWQFGRG